MKVSNKEFSQFLSANVEDYCMLLEHVTRSDNKNELYYILSDTEFFCLLYNIDRSLTIEMCVEMQNKDLLLELINGQYKDEISKVSSIAAYKHDVFDACLERVFKCNCTEYIVSYIVDKKNNNVVIPREEVLVTDDVSDYNLTEFFLNQQGNHLLIIQKQTTHNSSNNRLLYIVENKVVIGYIAICKQYDNIWDVSYIFIDRNYRRRGYATYLCSIAIEMLETEGKRLFYSYAENDASRKVAMNNGLKECAQRFVYSVELKT